MQEPAESRLALPGADPASSADAGVGSIAAAPEAEQESLVPVQPCTAKMIPSLRNKARKSIGEFFTEGCLIAKPKSKAMDALINGWEGTYESVAAFQGLVQAGIMGLLEQEKHELVGGQVAARDSGVVEVVHVLLGNAGKTPLVS